MSGAGRRLVAAGTACTAALLASCTGGTALPGEEDDVAVLRVEPSPPPAPPRPGDLRDWPGPPVADDAETVLDRLAEALPLGFSQEPAGIYPGTRWAATTGSRVTDGDVERAVAVLVDSDDRVRSVSCNAAGPIDADDPLLRACAEALGLPDDVLRWLDEQVRSAGARRRTAEREAGTAVVQVSTSNDGGTRSQSLQVQGARIPVAP